MDKSKKNNSSSPNVKILEEKTKEKIKEIPPNHFFSNFIKIHSDLNGKLRNKD